MSPCHRILMTGLPAGVGVSSLALSLADALLELKRSVRYFAPVKDLAVERAHALSAVQLDYGTILRASDGLDRIPLESLDASWFQSHIVALSETADYALVDHFTGLSIKNSPWYDLADEIVLVLDGRPKQAVRNMAYIARVRQYWSHLPMRLVLNRLPKGQSAVTASQELRSMLSERLSYVPSSLAIFHESKSFQLATREGLALTRIFPNSPEARCMRQMARQLLHTRGNEQNARDVLAVESVSNSTNLRLS
jgi:MinD-like ATPase involved in chromosome partitioning or flagellar assembly